MHFYFIFNLKLRTIEKYINRTECMIQQYNEYFDKQVNLNVNGQQTLSIF
jgi:hypothetical protein